MSENPTPTPPGADGAESAPVAPPPPKRGPGHRGQDIRDTMAEMAAKAHEISLEAGSRMAATMREVIGAAAGISAFAIESARDLVNYMVRRGQMSQDEANKLMREVEEAHASRPKVETPRKPDPGALKPAAKAEAPKPAATVAVADAKPAPPKATTAPAAKPAPAAKAPSAVKAPPAPKAPPAAKAAPVAKEAKAAAKPAARAAAPKAAPAKAAPKAAAKKPAVKKKK